MALFVLLAGYGYTRNRSDLENIGLKGIYGSLSIAVVVSALKVLFARPLPPQSIHEFAVGFGFPSGHTTTAFFIAGLLSYRYKRLEPFLFLYAIVVGFSRVYLGTHYPTDVLAGAVLGLFIAEEVWEAKFIKWAKSKLD